MPATLTAATLQAVAATFAYWLVYADTHCWKCEKERDYDADEQCPHCGADQTPF